MNVTRSSFDWSSLTVPSDAGQLGVWRKRAFALVFGDRVGLVIFLGTLAALALFWRVGIFISDSYAVGNALVNVAAGRLEIVDIPYSLTMGSQPGLHVVDGKLYGRNYGHAFVALPVYWLLEGLAALFDFRLVLVAGWSLLLLAFFDQLGRVLGRRRQLTLAGCVVALLTFAANLVVVSPLAAKWTAFVALQLTTMAAAALVGVGLYRLLSTIHDQRTGIVVGSVAVLGTALGFWSSLPKRHAIVALAVVVILSAFYASRAAAGARAFRFRALAYAVPPLIATLHAPEALGLFLALVPLDLATADSNSSRKLAVLGVVFLVALTPFMFVNAVVTGNPLVPIRSVPDYEEKEQLDAEAQAFGGGANQFAAGEGGAFRVRDSHPSDGSSPGLQPSDGPRPAALDPPSAMSAGSGVAPVASSSTGTSDPARGTSGGLPALVVSLVMPVLAIVDQLGQLLNQVLGAAVNRYAPLFENPDRLYHTFVRSGRIPGRVQYHINEQEAVELSMLEATPLLGVLAGLPAVALRRLSASRPTRGTLGAVLASPVRQTDLLATAITAVFLVGYLPKLPLHSQITVRYLLPLVPVGLYALGRFGPFQRAANTDWRWLVGPYLFVLVGGCLGTVAVHLWVRPAIGEAMQLHALFGLGSACIGVVWAVVAGLGLSTDARIGSIALAVPAAAGTILVLFTGLLYFRYAEFALPAVRALTDLIPVFV